MRWTHAIVFLACALPGACSENDDPKEKQYFKAAGGGFVFYLREGIVRYGLTVEVTRRLPSGAVIEARFENPSGGEPLLVKQTARPMQVRFLFHSPPVQGVEAGRDYQVELRLLDPETQQVLSSFTRSYRSEISQADWVVKKPLVVGPGYQANPEVERERVQSP